MNYFAVFHRYSRYTVDTNDRIANFYAIVPEQQVIIVIFFIKIEKFDKNENNKLV